MTERVLALIPARGGSKGIPGKNIMTIGGKPLIAHTILQAQASQRINRVIVSTDDEQIAAVSREWGAELPFIRPAEFAQDLSPDIDVFRHALNWLREHEGYVPDLVVHLRPTGPVRRIVLIDQAIGELAAHPEADALRSVARRLEGAFTLVAVDKDAPGTLVAARRNSPLVVGVGEGEMFVADITEVVVTGLDPGATKLVIESWTPARGLRRDERT